ncbi:hypothetical protein KI387_013791, partial [Taxus chinensis]
MGWMGLDQDDEPLVAPSRDMAGNSRTRATTSANIVVADVPKDLDGFESKNGDDINENEPEDPIL